MIKRIFDIIVSALGILILSPFFFLIAIIIKLDSKGPLFFRQERVGLDEKIFKIYKFRTMIDKAWEKGTPITVSEKDQRISRFGKLLRKYKLDELPQLINVLRGDMSLVGPRPEIPKYVTLYDDEQKKVLSVRPGITDYASLVYFKEAEILAKSNNWEADYINKIMPAKLALNIKYIKEQSLWLDLKLILQTIFKIK